jgi:hypothetical protein
LENLVETYGWRLTTGVRGVYLKTYYAGFYLITQEEMLKNPSNGTAFCRRLKLDVRPVLSLDSDGYIAALSSAAYKADRAERLGRKPGEDVF